MAMMLHRQIGRQAGRQAMQMVQMVQMQAVQMVMLGESQNGVPSLLRAVITAVDATRAQQQRDSIIL